MRGMVALLVACCVAVVSAALMGWLAHGLNPVWAQLALLLGAVAGWAAWRRTGPFEPAPRPKGWAEWGVLVFFALFALRLFCWVAFYRDDEIACLTPNNLGDLSLHLTFIRYLANGVPFWPENPIHAGHALQYPVGVDLFNALLVMSGVDILRGLVWAGLVGSVLTAMALWRWGGAFAVAGFLFNGGFAAWRIIQTGEFYEFQDAVAWKSIPIAMFVTQRGFLYALPVGLLLLWSWRNRFLLQRRGLPAEIELLFYATLPLFHLHTFLFLSGMLAFWYLSTAWKNGAPRGSRGPILRLVLCALLPASWLVWLLTEGFQSQSMIHFRLGWMQRGHFFFRFWGENFGVLPLCVIALILWVARRLERPRPSDPAPAIVRMEAALVFPAVLWFALCCFVMFAAWEWDNTKIMIWSYLVILPPLWAMLRQWRRGWRVTTVILLFFSGFLTVCGGMRGTGYRVSTRSELDFLRKPLRQIPMKATFACVPTYNHPLLLLGRKVVSGYEGHLISHGFDISRSREALRSLLLGRPGWQDRARELGAEYLFWGTLEQREYGTWPPAATREPVLRTPRGDVYRLLDE